MPGRLTVPVFLALALLAAGPVPVRAAEPSVGCVEIPTRAPNNPLVKVWCRVPEGSARLAPREAIDPEYLNPLYDDRLADLWRRDAP